MGKRFGRNQKRKLRESIWDLEETVSKQQRKINSLNNHMEDFIGWDREISQLLGRNSAYRAKVDEIFTPGYPPEFIIHSAHPVEISHGPFDILPMELVTTKIRLSRLMMILRSDPNSFSNRIRIQGTDGKTSAAMYIDEQYIQDVGLTDRDVEFFGQNIARQLADYLNKPSKPTPERT